MFLKDVEYSGFVEGLVVPEVGQIVFHFSVSDPGWRHRAAEGS
jgi:hypothetical protein